MKPCRAKPSNRKENKATVLRNALTYNFRQTHRGDTARSASKKGRTVDAEALAGDEGRDKLR